MIDSGIDIKIWAPRNGMSARDQERLTGVHPTLIAKIGHILAEMADRGRPMMVAPQGGVRTDAEQARLYAQGRRLAGRIVTHCDGVIRRSKHQVRADGYGHAVDCCFSDVPYYDERGPWGEYGALAESLGLVWGGRWPGKRRDRPHVENPNG